MGLEENKMTEKSIGRGNLVFRIIINLVGGFLFIGAMFFIPAGTWDFWQAWVYLALLFIPMTFLSIYLLKNDPELLERRMRRRETRQQQKAFIILSGVSFFASYLIPGFDRRYGWSNVPTAVVITAEIIVLLAYGFFFLVLRENSFASRVIEVEKDQKVITSGPYAIVRHPMYSGMTFLYVLSPLALGSWIGILPALLLIPLLVMRTIDEEKKLVSDLPGYIDYMQKVRFRLIPGIW